MNNKNKIIFILVFLLIIVSSYFVGYNSNFNNDTIKYGDYITFKFEDNDKTTLSLDLKKEKYYYADKGIKSAEGNLKKLDNNVYKFNTGVLKNDYLILTQTTQNQTLYIHGDYVTSCLFINNQLTIIGE